MVTLTIDNKTVTVPAGTTILEAARTVDIHIPTLCYLKEINEVASCRVCAVEVEGVDKLATACNTQVEDGMVVHTNTQRVRVTRKTWSSSSPSTWTTASPACAAAPALCRPCPRP